MYNLHVLPYLVGLIPVCIYTDAMHTKHLRSFLTVIKLRGTVRPIGFWSTGAASGESRQKNQNVIYVEHLKITYCHSKRSFHTLFFNGVFLMKSIYLAILTIPLIIMHRGKVPVQQRLKNHAGFEYIHECLTLWENPQPFFTFISANPEKKKRLRWAFSRVRAWKSPLQSESTQTLCFSLWPSSQVPKPLRLAIRRNAVSGQSLRVGYLFTPTPQHVAAVVSAVAQLSGKCSEQKETFGAERVGRTK